MPDYRRIRVKGGCFFFTIVTEGRRPILIDNIHLLRLAFYKVITRYPFKINGIVILPDHLHCVWTLPDNDDDYISRWRLIKSEFSRQISRNEPVSLSRLNKGERGIWQRRFWEHLFQHEQDYRRHIDYIHYNPVKHGYVARPSDWPYSSFLRCVDEGMYEREWAEPIDKEMERE